MTLHQLGALYGFLALAGIASANATSPLTGPRFFPVPQENDAPGAPGKMDVWASPNKSAYGTTPVDPLWFSMVDGWISEVCYPFVDRPQTRATFIALQNTAGKWTSEFELPWIVERVPGTLAFLARSSTPALKIDKLVTVIPGESALAMDVSIQLLGSTSVQSIALIHDPATERTSGGDQMEFLTDAGVPVLRAFQSDIRGDEPASSRPWSLQELTWSFGASQTQGTVGFRGVNAPTDQLRGAGRLSSAYSVARNGNVEGALLTSPDPAARELRFRVILRFRTKKESQTSLAQLLSGTSSTWVNLQKSQWQNRMRSFRFDRADPLLESSVLVLEALADKSFRGAMIAGPGNPSLPWTAEAPEHPYDPSRLRQGDSNAGYRRVWPRDLYHKALALLAVGDAERPVATLRWLAFAQLKEGWRAGTWPQNTFVDGTPSWNAFQIDETAYPLILLKHLVDRGLVQYSEFLPMSRLAFAALERLGPWTEQERWEENGGLSPSSFAAAQAAVLAFGKLETRSGDPALGARADRLAKYWGDHRDSWLLIQNGKYGSGYFARLELGHAKDWNPAQHLNIVIQNRPPNSPNTLREDEVLDGGFLEWALLGLSSMKESAFQLTTQLIDRMLKAPSGAYYRYTGDSYGAHFKGGGWPLLRGERAIAGLELGEDPTSAIQSIRAMASRSGMIPEQDTLSVSPLGWSHANYILLRRSATDRKNFYSAFGR